MADRVRIIHPDGHISVVDKEFSQMVELLKPCTDAQKHIFWARTESVVLPDGTSLWLVKEGV